MKGKQTSETKTRISIRNNEVKDIHSSLLTDFGCTVTEISHPNECVPPTLHYI